MTIFSVRRRRAWVEPSQLEATAVKSERIANGQMRGRLRWIRSYILQEADGSLGSICIYEAHSAEVIAQHARLVGMPADEITPIRNTVIVQDDPIRRSRPETDAWSTRNPNRQERTEP
ncbi:DUF4242 domain-containing protein [Chelativorans intermedius]|uniref:DUF4242 domain-containing protein n=1 Tax=Chelativorans intermedius TaxID=515947 RepID=A0ABV6D7E2_9HYPH|nr:DUF4242 domain-containing protein [Chelativorans intermedius]MCT8999286.1 DUF4242 domain-containing protein [Chelativorans intermedius]